MQKSARCHACRKEVTEAPRVCPHCGAPNPTLKYPATGKIVVILSVVIVTAIAMDLLHDRSATSTSNYTRGPLLWNRKTRRCMSDCRSTCEGGADGCGRGGRGSASRLLAAPSRQGVARRGARHERQRAQGSPVCSGPRPQRFHWLDRARHDQSRARRLLRSPITARRVGLID